MKRGNCGRCEWWHKRSRECQIAPPAVEGRPKTGASRTCKLFEAKVGDIKKMSDAEIRRNIL